jgi:CBS domain-containing protein
MRVQTILRSKRGEVFTIVSAATVAEAAQRLSKENVGALVVSGDGRSVDGIISERDIVHALASRGARALQMRVHDLMSKSVRTCTPNDTIKGIMAEMTSHRIRHVPVVDGGVLCGMVSIGDVVKNRLEELELEANVIRDAYIARR